VPAGAGRPRLARPLAGIVLFVNIVLHFVAHNILKLET
jgi:hypothetical protein